MGKKIIAVLITMLLILSMVPTLAFAGNVSLTLNPAEAAAGEDITVSGTADPDTFVSIKVLDTAEKIVYYDVAKSDEAGNYSHIFKVPDISEGILNVIAGYGHNVICKELVIGNPTTDVTLTLSSSKAKVKSQVTASGTADPNTWVCLKVVDSRQNIVYFDGVKADGEGKYCCTFKVPNVAVGVLKVVAGYGENVTVKDLTVIKDSGNSGGHSSGGGGGGGNTDTPVTPPAQGEKGKLDLPGATTSKPEMENGQKVTTVTVDEAKALKALKNQTFDTVVITAAEKSDVVEAQVTSGLMKELAAKKASVQVSADAGSYTLPAEEVNTTALAQQLGVQANNVNINIVIEKVGADQSETVQNTASAQGMKVLANPVEFKVEATAGDKKVSVNRFHSYVSRSITLNAAVDTRKAVGAVLNADGSLSPVPTQFTTQDGKTIAGIKRMTNSVYTIVENEKSFADVANHWAKDDVNLLASKLIVNGMGENTYAPEGQVTRAQFAAIIVRAMGLPDAQNSAKFNDVQVSHWYANAVNAAVEAGIIKGYTDGTFKPNSAITRQEVAVMVQRSLGVAGMAVQVSNINGQIGQFADGSSISNWAKDAVALTAQQGIVNGMGDGSFAPAQTCTRAQTAVMIKRMLSKVDFI